MKNRMAMYEICLKIVFGFCMFYNMKKNSQPLKESSGQIYVWLLIK